MRSKFNFLILLLIFPAFSSALFVSFFPRVGECLFLYFSSFGFLNDLFINFKLYGFRYDYQVLFFLINFLFCFFVFVLISFSGFHVRYSGGFFYDVFAISILIFCFFILISLSPDWEGIRSRGYYISFFISPLLFHLLYGFFMQFIFLLLGFVFSKYINKLNRFGGCK